LIISKKVSSEMSIPDYKELYHRRQRCVTSVADTQPILTFTHSQYCKRNFVSPWNFKVLLHYNYSLLKHCGRVTQICVF